MKWNRVPKKHREMVLAGLETAAKQAETMKIPNPAVAEEHRKLAAAFRAAAVHLRGENESARATPHDVGDVGDLIGEALRTLGFGS